MDIKKWLGIYSFDIDGEGGCVDVSDLLALLETHAIVPREPSNEMIIKGKHKTIEPLLGVEVVNVYKAMIREAEDGTK